MAQELSNLTNFPTGPVLSRWVNRVINGLTVGAVLALTFYGVQRLGGYRDEKYRGVPSGTQVRLSNVNWAGNRRTLVMVLQVRCQYCKESLASTKRS